jgi:hypothetical protein
MFPLGKNKPPDFSGGLKLFRAKSYSHHQDGIDAISESTSTYAEKKL